MNFTCLDIFKKSWISLQYFDIDARLNKIWTCLDLFFDVLLATFKIGCYIIISKYDAVSLKCLVLVWILHISWYGIFVAPNVFDFYMKDKKI